jgi:excisionase family DNA binding protein
MEQQQFIVITKDQFKELVTEAVKSAVSEVIKSRHQAIDMDELMTRKQTANLLGISTVTLDKYTQKGIFVAYKLGDTHVRYKRSEVMEVWDKQRKK